MNESFSNKYFSESNCELNRDQIFDIISIENYERENEKINIKHPILWKRHKNKVLRDSVSIFLITIKFFYLKIYLKTKIG
jgi:hypothetical protein